MGQTQSKSNEPKIKGIGMDQNQFDILDLIATNYITTQNFKDLTNLIKPDYCNKLVILTTDVINNYLKETKIEYLAKNEGGVNNKLKKEDIIYIQSKAKEDVLPENRQGGGIFDDDDYDDDDDDYLSWMGKKYNKKKPSDEKENKRLTLSYLDVKPSDKKQRMCIGIAKFYVTIAHLWSAILLSVNPQYKYTDSSTGKKKFVSFENRKDLQKDNIIERNIKVELTTENSLCDQRVNVLKNKNIEDGIINLTPVCNMNKIKTEKTNRKGYAPSEWGKQEFKSKNLMNEIGIPELEQLYNDYYNYETGVFSNRIPGGKADQQYKKDLELLYTSFTGNIDYEEWNKDGSKTFKDIILSQFDEACSVKVDSEGNRLQPIFKMNLMRDDDNRSDFLLFKKYADHIKTTKNTIANDRKNILSVLQEIFVIKVLQDSKEVVSINPKLTTKRLDEMVVSVREKIIKLYVTCEKNFKIALEIVNNIASTRKQDIIEEQKKNIEEQIDKTLVNSSFEKDSFDEFKLPKDLEENKDDPYRFLSYNKKNPNDAEKHLFLIEGQRAIAERERKRKLKKWKERHLNSLYF